MTKLVLSKIKLRDYRHYTPKKKTAHPEMVRLSSATRFFSSSASAVDILSCDHRGFSEKFGITTIEHIGI